MAVRRGQYYRDIQHWFRSQKNTRVDSEHIHICEGIWNTDICPYISISVSQHIYSSKTLLWLLCIKVLQYWEEHDLKIRLNLSYMATKCHRKVDILMFWGYSNRWKLRYICSQNLLFYIHVYVPSGPHLNVLNVTTIIVCGAWV